MTSKVESKKEPIKYHKQNYEFNFKNGLFDIISYEGFVEHNRITEYELCCAIE